MTKERTFLFTGALIIIILLVIANVGIPSRLGRPSSERYHANRDYPNADLSDRSLFYNMYGWRTQPPFEYPQKTINTPYDVTMRNCTRLCSTNKIKAGGISQHQVKDCHKSCQIKSLQKQGVPEPTIKEGYYRDSGLFAHPKGSNVLYEHNPPNVCSKDCVNSFSDEVGYSHGSPRHRLTGGMNDMSCFNW